MRTTNNVGKAVRFLLSFSLAAMLIAILGFILPSVISAGSGTWTPTGGPMVNGGQVNAIVVHPTTANTLLASVGIPGNGGATKIYSSTDGAANWTPVYTGTNQYNGLAITGTLAYAVGNHDYGDPLIIKSSDSGNNWTPVYTGKQNNWNYFRAVAINPTSTDYVYAVGDEGNGPQESGVVYRTTDGGLHWDEKLNVPQVCCRAELHAVAINPSTPNTVFVAGTGGTVDAGIIYRTTDGGNSWTPVFTSTDSLRFTSLLIDPTTPSIIYAGSGWGPNTVYKSTDGGNSWNPVHDQSGFRLAYDPTSNTIYSASDGGDIYTSTNGDVGSWSPVNKPPSGIMSLAFDSGTASLYAGLNDRGVFKSTDGGTNWTEKNSGIQSFLGPGSIVIDPQNPNKLFTGGGYPGGFRSGNGGATWIGLLGVPYLNSFAINPSNTSIVFAGGSCDQCSSIFRSTNGGLNWTGVYTASFILPDRSGGDEEIYGVAVDPVVTPTVYAAGLDNVGWNSQQGVLLKSTNGGLNWTVLMTTTSSQPGFGTLAVNPVTNTTVYAGGQECVVGGPCRGVIYRSTNGGSNWTSVMTSTNTVRSIVIDYQKPNVVYAADDNNNVYKTTDAGNNWIQVWDNSKGASGKWLAIDPHVPSHIYLAGYGSVAESVDGANNFSDWNGPLNNGTLQTMDPLALAVDHGATTQNLYLGLNGVWKYSRTAPTPEAAMTVTVPTAPVPGMAGHPMTVTALVVDRYQNWVADGTQVSFFTDLGSFQGGTSSPGLRGPRATVTKTTTNGVASASLTAPAGTANVVIVSGGKAVTLQVQFTNVNLYLPLIVR